MWFKKKNSDGNKLNTALIQVGSPAIFDSLSPHMSVCSYTVRFDLNVKFKFKI